MYEEIIEFTGKETGFTSMVIVGVHGNEVCGVEALKNILPNLKIEKGKVFFAYGNPRAIKQNVRFTEVNLNRMFKLDSLLSDKDKQSYEYNRAQFLKKYLDQADALLDVHASFTPESRRFVICEPNAKEIVETLPFSLIVSGFDQVEPGGTDYYMNKKGGIGICVECGFLGDLSSTDIAEQSIMAFLQTRGHITGERHTTESQSYIRMYDLYLTQTNDFNLSKSFVDFEEIKSGQILGKDGEKEVKAMKDSVILFARNTNEAGDEAFLLGEDKEDLA
jgi:succinylglutamate desuccinylase